MKTLLFLLLSMSAFAEPTYLSDLFYFNFGIKTINTIEKSLRADGIKYKYIDSDVIKFQNYPTEDSLNISEVTVKFSDDITDYIVLTFSGKDYKNGVKWKNKITGNKENKKVKGRGIFCEDFACNITDNKKVIKILIVNSSISELEEKK